MSLQLYDNALYNKIQSWVNDPNMRILKTEETQRLFQVQADLNNDGPIKLPLIAISRDKNIEFIINTKRNLSYDGLKLKSSTGKTVQLNAIPFTTNYQIDIYTEDYEDAYEYLREFSFNFINNPQLQIEIPYNGVNLIHVANLKLIPTLEDNSDIPERLFPGQFTRWTLILELQDAYMFNTKVRNNWIVSTEFNLEVEENIVPNIDMNMDYEENSSLNHNGFTHIAEKESN